VNQHGPRVRGREAKRAVHQGRCVDDDHPPGGSYTRPVRWWRGPRLPEELRAQEALFPREEALAFGVGEAARAASLYREVALPRGREVDLAVAAFALERGGSLWTLNRDDFEDIPGLDIV